MVVSRILSSNMFDSASSSTSVSLTFSNHSCSVISLSLASSPSSSTEISRVVSTYDIHSSSDISSSPSYFIGDPIFKPPFFFSSVSSMTNSSSTGLALFTEAFLISSSIWSSMSSCLPNTSNSMLAGTL